MLDRSAAARAAGLADDGFAFGMLAQHEQQHDETMLATHQLRAGAGRPRTRPPRRLPRRPSAGRGPGAGWPVRDGHVHRAVGAGQRTPRTPGRRARRSSSTPRRSPTRVRGVRRGRRLRRRRAGGASGAGRTARRRARARRSSGRATAAAGGGAGSACIEPSCRDEPVLHVCWFEARGLRALGRASGCRPRPSGRRPPGTTRRRPVAALPVGRRRPRPRARQPRAAPPRPGAGRGYPGGRVAARACTS